MPGIEIETVGKSTRYEMILDAPRNFVWNLRFGEDYAPKPLKPGYKVKSYSVEYREGGAIRAVMSNNEGDRYEDKGVFIRIDPDREIVWELSSGCIPGLKVRFDEHFEKQGDQTKYSVDAIFENEELLSNAAELGCEKVFGQYLEHFGDLVHRMVKTEKVVK